MAVLVARDMAALVVVAVLQALVWIRAMGATAAEMAAGVTAAGKECRLPGVAVVVGLAITLAMQTAATLCMAVPVVRVATSLRHLQGAQAFMAATVAMLEPVVAAEVLRREVVEAALVPL
jgi:hypothetical protein